MGNNHVHLVSQGELDAALFMLRADLENLRSEMHRHYKELWAAEKTHIEEWLVTWRSQGPRLDQHSEEIRSLNHTQDAIMAALIALMPGFGEAVQQVMEVQDGVDLERAAEAERLSDLDQADVTKLVQDNTWTEEGKGG